MRKLLFAAVAVLAVGSFAIAPAFADKGGTPNTSSGNTTGGSVNSNSATNGNDISGTPGNQGSNANGKGNAGGSR